MSFGEYLQKVSLGGLLTLLALTAMLPWLMRDIWNLKRESPAAVPTAGIARPFFAAEALLVLAVMVLLFLFGGDIPTAIAPPAVAIVAAALGLLVVQAAKV
jgi:Na+/H+ antiporter NhaD/arsenite permease-like protein